MIRTICIIAMLALTLTARPAFAVHPDNGEPEEPEEAAQPEETRPDNPIRDVAEMMKKVGVDMGGIDLDELIEKQREAILDAQEKILEKQDAITEEQKEILEKLDILIEMAEQAESPPQGEQDQDQQDQQDQADEEHHGRDPQADEDEDEAAAEQDGSEGTTPAGDETDVGRDGQYREGRPPPDDWERWGELAPMLQDRGFRSLTDQLPAKYREMLQRYFRAMGQE